MSRAPLLSSFKSPWKGILLEQHKSGSIENLDVAPADHMVGVQLTQSGPLEWTTGSSRFREVRVLPFQVSIFPALQPVSVRSELTGEFVVVSIEQTFLSWATADLTFRGPMELLPHRSSEDSLVSALVLGLKTEVAKGNPGGRCYGEALALSLCVHLATHFSSRRLKQPEIRGGLASFQLRRTIEFIDAHLAQDISLRSLAQVAGLSPFHFARQFKRSTGLAPHQFILRARVERARALLMSAEFSMADIALQVGFCDQSHLAAHFKRIYGIPPKSFLQTIRGKSPGLPSVIVA